IVRSGSVVWPPLLQSSVQVRHTPPPPPPPPPPHVLSLSPLLSFDALGAHIGVTIASGSAASLQYNYLLVGNECQFVVGIKSARIINRM
ncbi:MAG: hypothetical protein EZS28_035409, partial [Streblomastix strix]